MASTSKKTESEELQKILSKMPIELCCLIVLPEFGLRWREVSKAVSRARLPMTPTSVARVLCRQYANTLPSEEIFAIMAKISLKCLAYSSLEDVHSLLPISNTNHNEQPDYLTMAPSYSMVSTVTYSGIVYTSRDQIEQPVEGDPDSAPLLETFRVTFESDFVHQALLNKKIKITIIIESEDIEQSLVSSVVEGLIPPDSELLQIFHETKYNNIHSEEEEM